jgi:hypothetical protein
VWPNVWPGSCDALVAGSVRGASAAKRARQNGAPLGVSQRLVSKAFGGRRHLRRGRRSYYRRRFLSAHCIVTAWRVMDVDRNPCLKARPRIFMLRYGICVNAWLFIIDETASTARTLPETGGTHLCIVQPNLPAISLIRRPRPMPRRSCCSRRARSRCKPRHCQARSRQSPTPDCRSVVCRWR